MKMICIVDDNPKDAEQLKMFVEQFSVEKKIPVSIRMYKDGLEFLANYKTDADVIFLDVEMPILSGLDVAKKLRQFDPFVCIVFVTNMVQYALKGYEVAALDYVIKPISYYGTADRLKRAFARNDKREVKNAILNISAGEIVRVPVTDIDFIEKKSNYLIYHTTTAEYKVRGQMKEIENELVGNGFSMNINGCMVNLGHVERMTLNSVIVGGRELPVARQRRKEFMNDLMNYFGQGGAKNL